MCPQFTFSRPSEFVPQFTNGLCMYLFIFLEIGSHYVAQAGLELGSNGPPALPTQVTGTTDPPFFL